MSKPKQIAAFRLSTESSPTARRAMSLRVRRLSSATLPGPTATVYNVLMARPRKEGMDYFPHDTDALSDEKVEALRVLYGNDGYAFFFILLERIYRMPNGELDVSDAETRQVLANKVSVDLQKFEQMINTALKWGAFDSRAFEESGILTSNGIKKRRDPVLKKRETMRGEYQKKVSATETMSETPQSKGKQSGVKKRAYREQPAQLDSNDDQASPVNGPLSLASLKEAGGSELKSVINKKTVLAIKALLQSHLNRFGYWNDTQLCKKRLDQFISALVTEAEKKTRPTAWLVDVAPKRLSERLDDFKPSRHENEAIEADEDTVAVEISPKDCLSQAGDF